MPLTMNLIRQLIDEHVVPEDVFSYQALRRWAIANGFTNPNESAEWRKTVVEAHLAKCKRPGSDAPYFEHGTIEGQLRELGISRNRDKLVIVDALTGQHIPCYLTDERLESTVRQAWKCRVRVEGRIKVDRQTSQPLEMAVDDIRILRERDDLPQMKDLHGIDITDGVKSSEYVRDLRDGG